MTPETFDDVEAWAEGYVRASSLAGKLAPPAPPTAFRAPRPAPRPELRPTRPGLEVAAKAPKKPKRGALGDPRARGRLLHGFLHHELQAAELMCWAVLAYPETPEPFRRGLVEIALDEVRHAQLYAAHMERLGVRFGAVPVRDWFWERMVACATPLQFVAAMGLGFEGGNLEHTRRYAGWFREVGDEEGAAIQERIGREEIAHVRFAARWFATWKGALDFDAWVEELPPPLSPMVLRGKPLDRAARAAAGLDEAFLDALEAWSPAPRFDAEADRAGR